MHNIVMLSVGHIHSKGFCEAVAKRDDAKLVAIWDDMADRGKQFAKDFGAKFVADLDAAIGFKGVDGFIICAENTRHLPLLKAAIPAGVPIFCEKPFVTTVAQARQAMKLIAKHGTTVHMGYFQPFSAQLQGVMKLLADGVLGKITHARYRNAHHAAYGRWFDSPALAWFTDPKLAGGGAFMDMGTHAVHAMRTLLGPVDRAWAAIGNASGEYPKVDDWGIAHLQFASGVMGTVEAAWVQTGGVGGLEITGSKATLFNTPKEGLVYAEPRHDPAAVPPGAEKPTRVDRLIAAIEGRLTKEELAADLAAAADAVAIMEACYQSAKTGAWVDVEKI